MIITRRFAGQLLAGVAVTATLGRFDLALAAEKAVTVALDLSLTGADAEGAKRVEYGALLAFDEANAAGGAGGYKINVVPMDDGSATAGQYDPAQAATNARKMASDKSVVAALGPQMSGAGKAMSPILSMADLATITPSSTNPDITDPKFAAQYRPAGKAVYFRTVTTDAYQGPNMANYFADVLKTKSIFVLDDSGAYGVGLADAFQGQAEKKGIKVLGRDRLDPKAADYSAILTKVKSLNPDGLYYGGVLQAGVKLLKQAYDILPATMVKGGGDGLYGPEILTAVGFPAAEGWYCSNASPHSMVDPKSQDFIKRYTAKFNVQPDDYAITAYVGAQVIVDAIKRVAATGKPVTRSAVRDAIQGTKLDSLIGSVEFDANGDLVSKVVSIFQVKKDVAFPLEDMSAQLKYIGIAPAT
ncbi:MAG TPA: branched-chain amino acid ABC transporter substrate-binding protein [Stellaceae bacterium]|nr:branched-chain amino acid ABC transporter substrate-binding protein [Stellaceae bacterium]